MSLASIIGMGIVISIIAYFIFQLKTMNDGMQDQANHFILQLLLIFFLFSGLLIMGAAILQESQDCTWLPANETINGNVTTIENVYQCNETSGPANNFFKITTWLFRLVAIYIFFYFCYEVLRYFGFITPKEQ